MSADVEPTPDQLTAMAFVDGELSESESSAFHERLASDAALRLEVSELRGLAVLARASVPPEPADHEWKRMLQDPLHKLLYTGGFIAIATAAGCLLLHVLLNSLGIEFSALAVLASFVGPLGLASLLAAAIRWRTVELPHDPYVKVQR